MESLLSVNKGDIIELHNSIKSIIDNLVALAYFIGFLLKFCHNNVINETNFLRYIVKTLFHCRKSVITPICILNCNYLSGFLLN